MSFKYEIKHLKETAKKEAVMGIMIGIPDDDSMPTSDIYYGAFDEEKDSYFCFWINSVLMDVALTKGDNFWCVDNEGQVYTTSIINNAPLSVDEGVSFGYKEELLSNINSYKFSNTSIDALWADDEVAIFADSKGVVWHIKDEDYTVHNACPEPSSFFGKNSNDLYLYGRKGGLWHFDGSKWSEVSLPDVGLDYWSISDGIKIGDEILFVTSYGFVFKGSQSKGFAVFNAPKKNYSGISEYQGRFFVCSKDEGLFEVEDINGEWELFHVTPARNPLSLDSMGEGRENALIMVSATDLGKPHFVVAIPGEEAGEKKRAYSWEININ